MRKYEDILVDLGLSPNEAKIYKALLDLKKGSIWNISSYANIHRRNTYDAIQRLIDKGLVFQVLPKKFLTYAPVHPDKLREMVEEKTSELETALPFLVKKFNTVNQPQSIYIYKGVAGLKNYITLQLEVGKTIHGIGMKGTWFDPRIEKFATKANTLYRKKKIVSKMIYDWDLREHKDVLNIIGKPYKFLPKKYSSGSSVAIFGDYVAVYSGVNTRKLDDEITIFIMKYKTLAEDYLKWFEFMWDYLPN